jgi:polar amino acid transport system substrate-binding protein
MAKAPRGQGFRACPARRGHWRRRPAREKTIVKRSLPALAGRLFAVPVLFALALAADAAPVLAQGSVPPSLIQNTRPMQGDKIRFCIDGSSPGGEFNREVSQAVADALLVDAEFTVSPKASTFPLDGGGYMDELQLVMSQSCEVFVGISILPEGNSAFPEWATVTRPFAAIPFVFVVREGTYKSLGEIPGGERVGITMGSLAQMAMIAYVGQQPQNARWITLPYGDPKLMLKRLEDKTLSGMAIYLPSLLEITNNDPAALGLTLVPFSPVQRPVAEVGNMLSARDDYLRTQLDEAIGSLIADGTIGRLLEKHGYVLPAGS